MFPVITMHPYFCPSPEMALRYSVTDTAATSATVPPKTSGTHSYHRLNSDCNCFLLLSETIQWQKYHYSKDVQQPPKTVLGTNTSGHFHRGHCSKAKRLVAAYELLMLRTANSCQELSVCPGSIYWANKQNKDWKRHISFQKKLLLM